MTETQPTSYEAAFAALQEIIAKLEDGDLSLEESLKLYEEGKKLSDHCGKLLEKAQLRVSTLSGKEDEDIPF
ncbi:MAG: exodeoxyribonuclease VII small subunit [Anaerolineaceae bacterium]|jgi:exodeoxyribonuclease VII small subunit|nr:exodeoxyribonuclease VII small subunit [Anaerolineaceae bacterium]MDD4043112.1 exodeoxyribonuclease VII small subunit [Anaerolineaceae bacterium]MDD4576988.1 exodeoxyribonuclease VII small subunit [Anaerolineaceae bacterium]